MTEVTSWPIWLSSVLPESGTGMSLVALHNGGGVGIGKAINGGFGMVCDGSERVDEILRSAMRLGCDGRSGPPFVGSQSAFNGN